MTWKFLILLFITFILHLTRAQLDGVAHDAVLTNAIDESRLPPHLLNGFYKDPQIRSALARSSWFGPGETVVVDREADNVSRQQIFTILKHAGFLPQQQV